MKRVLAFGTFDLLHLGHKDFLKQAKALGGHLTVIVSRDKSVPLLKNKKTIHREEHRRALVEALKPVDKAVLGKRLCRKGFKKNFSCMCETVKENNPDILALGYDQMVSEKALGEALSRLGLKPKIVRLKSFKPRQFKSSKIAQRIKSK